MENKYQSKNVSDGKLDVWQGEDDIWRITWRPERGHKDYPGHTYSPQDSNLPSGYPKSQDPGVLMTWAINHFRKN